MALIVVTARSDKITARDREHAKDKIQKLEKYFNGITRLEMILQRSLEQAVAEVVISVRRGGQMFCKESHKDLYAAIDLVLDKAEIQLTRHKEKIKERRGREAGSAVPGEREEGAEESGEETLEAYEDIVEKREFPAEGGTRN